MNERPAPPPLTYKSSGVDIDAQDRALGRVKEIARSTFTPGVLSEIGSFGGLFATDPTDADGLVLVASADGVGTKLQVAQMAGRYDSVGQDLVNHCVNDILVQGASPLFFLDYVAAGKLVPERIVALVEGLGRACKENGCALLGGETAEMPGLYHGDDFDLAGFIVGGVGRKSLLPSGVKPGQALVGLPSNGLHTNGYSLVRKLLFEHKGFSVETVLQDLGTTLGDALLAVHRSYLKPIRSLISSGIGVSAMAHITGGGIPDNLPRVLPVGVSAIIWPASWVEPPIFGYIRREGRVPEEDMRRTFNLGIGMIIAIEAENCDEALRTLRGAGENARVVGELVGGERAVEYQAT